MELQFNKTAFRCLRTAVSQVQNQEQTQEIRLPDGMPDIANVLGAWGQIVIRSKEWRSGGMSISGGVMVWILYASEEESVPQHLDTWIPFQMKWDFPDTGRDGVMQVSSLLRCVDARSTSARKLMIRVCVSVKGEAMVSDEASLYSPGQIPEDVQLLKKTYPLLIPKEAGEKPFVMEEDLVLPVSCPKLDTLVRYELRPELIDQKVMAGKAVFRGAAILHMLYLADDGNLCTWDFELPFSQFTELEGEYDQEATVRISTAVTSLELENSETGFHMKAGLTGQYVVYEHCMTEVVEDAYGTNRDVTPVFDQIYMPMVLDMHTDTVHAEQFLEMDTVRVAEVSFYPEYAQLLQQGDSLAGELSGAFNVLYYDAQGELKNTAATWQISMSMASDYNCRIDMSLWQSGSPQASTTGNGINLRAELLIDQLATSQQGLKAVIGLEVGEPKQQSTERPSLIIRRTGEDGLWDIAKANSTTVAEIQKANNLDSEPDKDKMLLIPVL